MKRMLLFTGSSGLNMEVDPVRHKYDPEKGVNELALVKNVDFDYTGRPSNRKGWQYTAVTGNCHSLFSDGGVCLFVTGNVLTLLARDLSTVPLRNVTVGARMSYAQVGVKVYYANGREIGFVRDNVSVEWSKPATVYHVKDTTKILSGPPVGSLLEYFNGRMYVVQQNVAWVSEQYDVNSFDLGTNFIPFESTVTMVKGVTEGLWVGTRSKVVFLRGSYPGDFRYEVKGLFGVIPGTDVKVDGFKVAQGEVPEVGVLFTGKYGPCFGTADGRLLTLADKKLVLPNALKGAGAVVGKKYVFTLED